MCYDPLMILGFHFIFSAYGFWLPNDPRGSWSTEVRQYKLRAFGEATKVNTTRSLANQNHDTEARLKAKRALKSPPVRFTCKQAAIIGKAMVQTSQATGYQVHALAVLPDHTHLVMSQNPKPVAQIAGHLKAKATLALTQNNAHPLAKYASDRGRIPSPWARNYWCVLIDSPQQMRSAIGYVERNPINAGLRAQRWNGVVPFVR